MSRRSLCPVCGAHVEITATVCPTCLSTFDEQQFQCPICQSTVSIDDDQCPICSQQFIRGDDQLIGDRSGEQGEHGGPGHVGATATTQQAAPPAPADRSGPAFSPSSLTEANQVIMALQKEVERVQARYKREKMKRKRAQARLDEVQDHLWQVERYLRTEEKTRRKLERDLGERTELVAELKDVIERERMKRRTTEEQLKQLQQSGCAPTPTPATPTPAPTSEPIEGDGDGLRGGPGDDDQAQASVENGHKNMIRTEPATAQRTAPVEADAKPHAPTPPSSSPVPGHEPPSVGSTTGQDTDPMIVDPQPAPPAERGTKNSGVGPSNASATASANHLVLPIARVVKRDREPQQSARTAPLPERTARAVSDPTAPAVEPSQTRTPSPGTTPRAQPIRRRKIVKRGPSSRTPRNESG